MFWAKIACYPQKHAQSAQIACFGALFGATGRGGVCCFCRFFGCGETISLCIFLARRFGPVLHMVVFTSLRLEFMPNAREKGIYFFSRKHAFCPLHVFFRKHAKFAKIACFVALLAFMFSLKACKMCTNCMLCSTISLLPGCMFRAKITWFH